MPNEARHAAVEQTRPTDLLCMLLCTNIPGGYPLEPADLTAAAMLVGKGYANAESSIRGLVLGVTEEGIQYGLEAGLVMQKPDGSGYDAAPRHVFTTDYPIASFPDQTQGYWGCGIYRDGHLYAYACQLATPQEAQQRAMTIASALNLFHTR